MPVFPATDLPDQLHCDICIVGSGHAGAIAAVALAKNGVDVSLLETGNEAPDFDLDASCAGVHVSDGQDISFGFSRQLGGASNLWSGRCAPLDEIDFAARPDLPFDVGPNEGWPYGRQVLAPYYDNAAKILGLPGMESAATAIQALKHQDALGAFLRGLLQQDGIDVKAFQWAEKPFNAGQYLKTEAARLSHLRVATGAHVTHLSDQKDGVISAVHVVCAGGRKVNVLPRFVVLAAGGLETPRILLNSPSETGGQIGNKTDCVGRYLSTHPKADMATLTLRKAIPTSLPLVSDQIDGQAAIRFGLGLSAGKLQGTGVLNHYVQLLPIMEYQANRAFEMIKGGITQTSPLINRSKMVRGLLPGLGLMAYEMLGRAAKLQRKAKRFILRGFLDQQPRRDNCISLSDEKDPRGMAKMQVQWTYSPQDRAGVLLFFDQLADMVKKTQAGTLNYDGLQHEEDWPLTGIHSHFMGTTRMGVKPETSVTNSDGRVHSAPNLYIAGPSLFPTYGFANPVFTISALSLKLADHLKIRLGE